MHQHGGVLGQAGLVVIGTENQLDDRRHRRAILDGQAVVDKQFVEISGSALRFKAEVVSPCDRRIKCLAAAILGVLRSQRHFARRSETIVEALRRSVLRVGIWRSRHFFDVLWWSIGELRFFSRCLVGLGNARRRGEAFAFISLRNGRRGFLM